MSKPVIAITTKTRFVGGSQSSQASEIQFSPINYINAVCRAGGIPILLPMVASEEASQAWLERVDGVILSGGMDLDPHWYGHEPVRELGGIDGPKDDMESIFIPLLLKTDIPTLGICRGIQVVNAFAGGTLFQDTTYAVPKPLKHSQSTTDERPTHKITIEPGSVMEKIFGGLEARVNSYHHQALDTIAEGFRVTARATDGIVEAIEHVDHPYMICVQFHPEMIEHLPDFHRLFVSHVEACKARKTR